MLRTDALEQMVERQEKRASRCPRKGRCAGRFRRSRQRALTYALADVLEEGGWLDLSFTYRWMGWYERRPGKHRRPMLASLRVAGTT
jgi:hypothetical protein